MGIADGIIAMSDFPFYTEGVPLSRGSNTFFSTDTFSMSFLSLIFISVYVAVFLTYQILMVCLRRKQQLPPGVQYLPGPKGTQWSF